MYFNAGIGEEVEAGSPNSACHAKRFFSKNGNVAVERGVLQLALKPIRSLNALCAHWFGITRNFGRPIGYSRSSLLVLEYHEMLFENGITLSVNCRLLESECAGQAAAPSFAAAILAGSSRQRVVVITRESNSDRAGK